jgi:serine/threonine-protein kinase
MTDPLATQPEVRRDEQLAGLLDELHRQLRQGERADIDGLAGRHPDLAEELRQLWAAAEFAEAFARSSAGGDGAAPIPATAAGTLPRRFGDYELLEELGRGAMGVVYKARQVSLKRLVALKMILRGELAAPEDLARFRAEAEAAARLDQDAHIVPVHEVGEVAGQPYFTMKYVEGTTLRDRLAQGPLPPRTAARYLAAVARAVHHAHQRGILHRDLKPSNLLIDGDDQPHVADFGLAKQVRDGASLTRTGAIVGTPCYMSPEQAFGSPDGITRASDVYSLGAILYELLTGRPPFRAATTVDTLLLVREQDPVPPRDLNPRVDPDLELICLQCLQKQPGLRYATAAQLADDLEAYLRGDAPSVRSSSVAYYLRGMLRETHHAAVLENWGLLWMWHSLKVLLLCALTTGMALLGERVPLFATHLPYLVLWGGGLVLWGAIFWALRRRAGPVMFVERQIAHVWAASVIATIGVFVVEVLLKLDVLRLSPVLAIIAGMVFLVKGGTLSGSFYIPAAVLFLTAVPMALVAPAYDPLVFGAVLAACFFFPGLKYYRQRLRAQRLAARSPGGAAEGSPGRVREPGEQRGGTLSV